MTSLAGYNFCEELGGETVLIRRMGRVLTNGQTPFQRYTIWESPSQGVCVTIDGDLQSTGIDRSTYHEALVHPAMILHGDPRSVLVCGGEGVTIRESLRYPGVKSVTMVDIDEKFVTACREHLPGWHANAFEDPRLTLLHEDIFDYVKRREEPFDVIIGDLTDLIEEVAPGRSFHSPGFYRSLRNLLKPEGVLCTQASALSLVNLDNHLHIREAVRTVFPHVASYRAHHDSFFEPWSFVVARSVPLPEAETLAQVFRGGFERHRLELAHFDPPSLASCFLLNRRLREKF